MLIKRKRTLAVILLPITGGLAWPIKNKIMIQIKQQIAKSVAFSFVLGIASCTQAQSTKPLQPEPGKGFAVIELFTSEGCSSCPPADRLIGNLQQENAGIPLYILSYHVDYWDHQGWKDRFSSKAWSQRQQQYLQWLNLETLYTPQIVVNGKMENVGSDAKATVSAINEALGSEEQGTITMQATQKGAEIEVCYQFNGQINGNSILLALVQKNASSNVSAGENTGKHLPHVQIVRAMEQEDASKDHRLLIKAPGDFSTTGWELIALVQNKKTGQIVSAAKSNINQ
ncbi:MAG: DUF1223 domain-containing protein [Chitinophagaceae bacterium]|nr:DUF1223 domain-containing protein [Chitinophagaceae bacterium]